jgi:hypothetical protein
MSNPPTAESSPQSYSQGVGLPTWVQELSPTQDPFAADLAGYWNACRWTRATPLPGPFAVQKDSGTDSEIAREEIFPPVSTPNKPSRVNQKFDRLDRLSLGDGWFLVWGGNAYYLELTGTGPDIAPQLISTDPWFRF